MKKETKIKVAEKLKLLKERILDNPYIPSEPFGKQIEFLLSDKKEILYGGSGGGGKSQALLMAALMYVDEPDYSALLLRRTYTDLSLPGALIDRSLEWLSGTDAEWKDKKKTWIFPSGATLTFGYLETEKDKYRYQGSEFDFIGFDELTQFTETQYLYLFSRLRQKSTSNIPLRMYSTSNPGGVGNEWVYNRFISEDRKAHYIPASYRDNPFINREEYEEALNKLDPVTREQLKNGRWDIRPEGNMFKREWFKIIDHTPDLVEVVRYWDYAATNPKSGNNPDYTVGVLMGIDRDKNVYILDVERFRGNPGEVKRRVYNVAVRDGTGVSIYGEEEPGSSGKFVTDYFTKELIGYSYRGVKSTGSKVERAKPFSAYVESGNVFLLRGGWVDDYINELIVFPNPDYHDDQVDASSGAFNVLSMRMRRPSLRAISIY